MRRIIIVVLTIIIIICSYLIVHKVQLYNKDVRTYEEVKELKSNKSILESKDLENELLKVNDDYKLWLNIDNTNIDYPVVQYEDNDFYLNHDFYKNDSISGCIFVDYRNNIDKDRNLIIYGHNMKNGSMFNDINKFKDESFFYDNNIKILVDNNEKVYEVFSVYVTSADKLYLKNNFTNDIDYLQYLNEVSNMSLFKKNIDSFNYNDIVTLISCSYEYSDARVIVHGIEKKRKYVVYKES